MLSSSEEPPPATQLFSVFKSAWMSGELWLTAFLEVESRDCGVNAILQQVWATAEHMPSGNQAGLLYRDSAVIISLGLLLLGTSVTHKHHLPENRSACLEHLSAGQGVVPPPPKKKPPHTCWRNKGTAFIAPNFFFRNQPCKHKTVKASSTGDGSPHSAPGYLSLCWREGKRHLKCLTLN